MKLILLVALMAMALSQPLEISADDDTALWELFKVEHSKVYSNDQKEHEKKNIFLKNLNFIREHNAKFHKGEVSYDLAINKFADMTAEEFHRVIGMTNVTTTIPKTVKEFNVTEHGDLPETVDWRKAGAVTRVKEQGECGSCWAFASTGTLEGQIFLKTKNLISLSEQNLMDCSRAYGTRGCHGGNRFAAISYVRDNEGIDPEDFYPYEGKDTETCYYNEMYKAAPYVKVNSPVHLRPGDEKILKIAVATVGPISVGVHDPGFNGGFSPLQFYKSGIFVDINCSQYNVPHSLLVVGYGTIPNEYPSDYWLLKNSWGTTWGMQGYVMMARNHNNMCGIANLAIFPDVTEVTEGL